MKLAVLLTIVAVLQATAGSYAQRITLKARNITLSKAMDEVHAQSGYEIFFNGKREARMKINVNLENASVEETMKTLLTGLPLYWTIKDKAIIVRPLANHNPKVVTRIASVQDREINGKVVDESGQPLAGVIVTVSGTTIATTTNEEGNYRLIIPENAKALVFAILGFETQEHPIGSSSIVNVSLAASMSDLDEVVVVGMVHSVSVISLVRSLLLRRRISLHFRR